RPCGWRRGRGRGPDLGRLLGPGRQLPRRAAGPGARGAGRVLLGLRGGPGAGRAGGPLLCRGVGPADADRRWGHAQGSGLPAGTDDHAVTSTRGRTVRPLRPRVRAPVSATGGPGALDPANRVRQVGGPGLPDSMVGVLNPPSHKPTDLAGSTPCPHLVPPPSWPTPSSSRPVRRARTRSRRRG